MASASEPATTQAQANHSAIMATYARLPVSFVRGAGVWLEDDQGKSYLDALSGISVCNLGHAQADIRTAIADQASTLLHTSNLYGIGLQETLAARLTELSGMESVFFGNSGAEANEAAIKIARKYGHSKNIDSPVVLVMQQSFHGRTMATLSATGNPKVQQGFEPLLSGFTHLPFGDVDAVAAAIANDPNIVAILVEPIQGESGVHIPPDGYLSSLRQLCDQHGVLLMLDEIQTGMGRTGKMFAFQHEACQPDVMTLAKALGNGVPIGACLARGKAAEALGFGAHGSTFGGNLLACRAALTVLEVMQRDNVVAQSAETGRAIFSSLKNALSDHPAITDMRHRGMMFGIEFNQDCKHLVQEALNVGLLINVCSDSIIRLLPPLIISEDEATQLVSRLTDLIHQHVK